MRGIRRKVRSIPFKEGAAVPYFEFFIEYVIYQIIVTFPEVAKVYLYTSQSVNKDLWYKTTEEVYVYEVNPKRLSTSILLILTIVRTREKNILEL